MKCIDLTHKYRNGMTFGSPENHPVVSIEQMAKLEEKGFNTSKITLGSHLGTHMDGKKHIVTDGQTTDEIEMERLIGDVTVVDFSHIKPGQVVTLDDVKKVKITEKMIFSFNHARLFGTPAYAEIWPYFSRRAVEYLIENGIRFIGMDVVGPDGKGDKRFECHKALFNADVVIVENIANTNKIDFDTKYTMMALPLSLDKSDGTPIRVVLVER